jgi:oligopeptide transport system permease protein
MAEASFQPAPIDFERVTHAREAQVIARPSLSYWQDAWIRLKANTRALLSLYLVIGIALFTLAGPIVWPVDPAAQDLDQVGRPPTLGLRARVVPPHEPWVPPKIPALPGPSSRLKATGEIRVVGDATTQAVRLSWHAVPGALGYAIYRNIFEPTGSDDLGIPLGETWSGGDVGFEDRLDLQPVRYYYSIVAVSRAGDPSGVATLEVEPRLVITARDARSRGLVADGGTLSPGAEIPLPAHPLGTDYLGRDMLARLMHGARVSLFIGVVAPLLFVMLGTMYGGLAGYFGGVSDQLLMRFADFVVALPFLLFMILFRIAFGIGPGENGIGPMLIALIVLGWPGTARLVRGQILQMREEGYIQAAKLLGANTNYLILRHMIPNTMGVILVTLTFAVPSAIFTEAFLSFIGMGVAPPTPSWGSMCNEGLKTMLTHPHELIFPAAFISVTVLAFNLLGDGLRDALDARMRARE